MLFSNVFSLVMISLGSFNNRDKKETEKSIKETKKTIHPFNGKQVCGKNFASGKITVIRRSLQDVFEHAIEDENIRLWLKSFDSEKLKSMKYQGWAPNRPYPRDHIKYDPTKPSKGKHESDTSYFNYYTIKIGDREYWVNVKMHKHYGEVLYTIEKEKPKDLIKGHKKK